MLSKGRRPPEIPGQVSIYEEARDVDPGALANDPRAVQASSRRQETNAKCCLPTGEYIAAGRVDERVRGTMR